MCSVAAELFAKHGYESTTVRMVANALGIKAGSLYYHIDSKEVLLLSVIDGALSKLIGLELLIAGSQLPPVEKLRRSLASHIAVGAETRNEMIVTAREADKLSTERAAYIKNKRRVYEQMFQDIIREGVAKEEFRALDVKMAAFAILGMANWLCQLYRKDGSLTLQQVTDICTSIVLDGLLTCAQTE